MTDFITVGSFDNHIKRIRQHYLAGRKCLLKSLKEAFGDISVKGLEGEAYLVWNLPKSLPAAELLKKAVRKKR